MIPTDMSFEFKRIQFPICLAFATTINKSQGQSSTVCGLNLENNVACSRVGKSSALFVLAPDKKNRKCSQCASTKTIIPRASHDAQ